MRYLILILALSFAGLNASYSPEESVSQEEITQEIVIYGDNGYQINEGYIKNNKFNFLKNLLIFPMKEINKKNFKYSLNKKINIKMSNMDMKISINKKKYSLPLYRI